MFAPTSRFHPLKTSIYKTPDGREIPYVQRRFLPRGEELPLLAEVTVMDGDRLDLIAARTIGDPEQFWRVCDANDAMNPKDLTAKAGCRLRVPVPQVEGER